jgi:hypothetical protein
VVEGQAKPLLLLLRPIFLFLFQLNFFTELFEENSADISFSKVGENWNFPRSLFLKIIIS